MNPEKTRAATTTTAITTTNTTTTTITAASTIPAVLGAAPSFRKQLTLDMQALASIQIAINIAVKNAHKHVRKNMLPMLHGSAIFERVLIWSDTHRCFRDTLDFRFATPKCCFAIFKKFSPSSSKT